MNPAALLAYLALSAVSAAAVRELEVIFPYEIGSDLASISILDRKDGAIYRHFSKSSGRGKTHSFVLTERCSNNVVLFLDDQTSAWSSAQFLRTALTRVLIPDRFHSLQLSLEDACLQRLAHLKKEPFWEIYDLSAGGLNPYCRLTAPADARPAGREIIAHGLNAGRHVLILRDEFNGTALFTLEFLVPDSGCTFEELKALGKARSDALLNLKIQIHDESSGLVSFMSCMGERRPNQWTVLQDGRVVPTY